jgi:hypothetical protein
MEHISLFEDFKFEGRYPTIPELLLLTSKNDPAKASAFIKKTTGNGQQINGDFIVRGVYELLQELDKAGLDSRYDGAIKKTIESLKPGVAKTKGFQKPKQK